MTEGTRGENADGKPGDAVGLQDVNHQRASATRARESRKERAGYRESVSGTAKR